jgi:hypothetical protein
MGRYRFHSLIVYTAVLLSDLVSMSNIGEATDTLDTDLLTDILSPTELQQFSSGTHESGFSKELLNVATSYDYIEDFSLVYFAFGGPSDPDWEDLTNLEHLVDIDKFTVELVQSYGYSYQTHEPSTVPTTARCKNLFLFYMCMCRNLDIV